MPGASGRPPTFEIPDLELEPVRPARPAPRPAASQARVEPVGFDDDFELESAQTSLGFGLEDAPPVAGGRGARREEAPWPTGQPPDPSELEIEFAAVEQLAAYGRADGPLYLSPLYALRVYQRRAELRRGLSNALSQLGEAEARRNRALSSLVRGSRNELEGQRSLAPLLARLRDAELRAGEQGRALDSLNAEVTTELGGIDSAIACVRAEIAELERDAAVRQSKLEALEANLKRAEARVKRVEIDIRAVREVAARRAPSNPNTAGGAVQLSSEEAARVAELTTRAGELELEVQAAKAPVDAARSELEALTREQRAREQRIREHESKKNAFVRKARSKLNQQGGSTERAASESLQAEVELGRELLKGRGSIPVATETLAGLRATDAEVLGAARNHELARQALDSFDRGRVRQGLSVAAALTLALIVLLVWMSS